MIYNKNIGCQDVVHLTFNLCFINSFKWSTFQRNEVSPIELQHYTCINV